jgi:hypothetical protein
VSGARDPVTRKIRKGVEIAQIINPKVLKAIIENRTVLE